MNIDIMGDLAVRRSASGVIAVTFISKEYIRTGLNWIAAMSRLGLHNYVVIAGDRETVELLDAKLVPCVRAHIAENRGDSLYRSRWGFSRKGLAMTALKFPVVGALLERGLSVILSDADATWLRNPIPLISRDVHIAFQRVFYHPNAIARLWSFAACSGFVVFRGGVGSGALVANCIREHRIVHDDQVAFNLALMASGITWNLPGGYGQRGDLNSTDDERKEFFNGVATRPITGNIDEYGLSVMALPHHTFWRHDWVLGDRAEIVVCHPNTPKDDKSKMMRCEQLGTRYIL